MNTNENNNKKIKVKYFSDEERLQKLGLTTLLERRMRNDLIETFQIINGISNYKRLFKNISLAWKFVVKTDFKN